MGCREGWERMEREGKIIYIVGDTVNDKISRIINGGEGRC